MSSYFLMQQGNTNANETIQEGMEKIMGPLGAFLNRFQMDRRHSRSRSRFFPFLSCTQQHRLVSEERLRSIGRANWYRGGTIVVVLVVDVFLVVSVEEERRDAHETFRDVPNFFFFFFDVLYFSNNLVKLFSLRAKSFFQEFSILIISYIFYLFSFLYDFTYFLKINQELGEQKNH